MKKLCLWLSFFSFVVFWGSLSCRKISDVDASILPSATHSGKGTMGFLLNGKRWVARSKDFKESSTEAVWGNNTLYVSGLNSASKLLFLFQDPKVGEYRLKNEESVRYSTYDSTPAPVLLLNDPGNKITITYYDGKIIAGTFSLVFKTISADLITITSGRFDISID